ncbi:cysteine proteinase [Saitoella complicata NRRL Y-17804]|uniref:cysteine proteinase n=1 Tax=Saitoella complicata (strain BCRC 22490 / CBS 7301 / JCM 7358 / NBRC 10748 / NRRL Y-17804) TaxID=698492 RepID=UPI000866AC1F|nr:cysteine proteinase [Saitoella complicata NRRL Y-17804]ODQ52621.1 cysteine proteinase [Saitoella complicata NRRL Y-17804]
MSKRPGENMNDATAFDSPASKRVRIKDVDDVSAAPITPVIRPPSPADETNGTTKHDHKEEEEEEHEYIVAPQHRRKAQQIDSDIYLDTITPTHLDFDFQKICSVSLSTQNIYCCLVCGKYFQGRGRSSHAFRHSVDSDHHVFMNLSDEGRLGVWVLPEGYEVKRCAGVIGDIRRVADPRYTKDDVRNIDAIPETNAVPKDLSGKSYLPGFVGLNNIKANDYVNVILQLLTHAPPIRNFFLLSPQITNGLPGALGALTRKIWNRHAFKGHISPHEILQVIGVESKKRFTLLEQKDPMEFLGWILNALHTGLGGTKKKPSIITKTFQGRVQVETQTIAAESTGSRVVFKADKKATTMTQTPFLFLTLDLPPTPLFQSSIEKNIIPQIPLTDLLKKYDGSTEQVSEGGVRRYRLLEVGWYLVLGVKRFTKNGMGEVERNPTIITLPPSLSLNLAPYLAPSSSSDSQPVIFDLLANIYNTSVPDEDGNEKSVWSIQLREGRAGDVKGRWWECGDLRVEEVRRELLGLREGCLQVWERRR